MQPVALNSLPLSSSSLFFAETLFIVSSILGSLVLVVFIIRWWQRKSKSNKVSPTDQQQRNGRRSVVFKRVSSHRGERSDKSQPDDVYDDTVVQPQVHASDRQADGSYEDVAVRQMANDLQLITR